MGKSSDTIQQEVASTGNDGHWLSIDEACRLLGVDQSTLRRWSDSGKVPVSRTPGGHRRYREEDVRRLLEGTPRARRRMSRQVLTDLSLSAYDPDYVLQAQSRTWYRAYSPVQLDEARRLGPQLVDLAVRSISGRSSRETVNAEGMAIGRRYGEISAGAGLTIDEAVDAFLFFRTPVIQAVARFVEEEALPARRAARIFGDITAFMDQVLVATITAHLSAGRS